MRKNNWGWYRTSKAALVLPAALCVIAHAHAQDAPPRYELRIEGGKLSEAVESIRDQTDAEFLYSFDLVNEDGINPVEGQYTLEEALELMFEGTGLSGSLTESGMIIITREKSANAQNREDQVADKSIKKGLLAGVATFLFGAGEAASQDEGVSAASDEALDIIIVTSTRREESLRDVPMAVTVVHPEDYLSDGLTSIGEIVDYTPGFNFVTDGSPRGKGTITARGVGQQSSTAVVGIYYDGVPLTSNSPWSFGSIFVFDGILADLERIEFIKGPQGTLYGATSIGGAIKYVSRKPSLDDFRGGATANLSTTRNGGLNQLYSGKLSGPLLRDKIGVTVSGYYEDNSGFVDRVDPVSAAIVDEDSNGYQAYGFAGDLLFQITDSVDFRFKGLHQRTEYLSFAHVSIDAMSNPLFGPLTNARGDETFDLENTLFAGTFNIEFDWATVTSTSAYTKIRELQVQDLTAAFAPFVDLFEPNPPGTTTSVPADVDAGTEKFTQELRLTSTDTDTLEWIFGLYYVNEDTIGLQSAIGLPTGFNLFTFDFPSSYEEYAAFGNLTYYFTDAFDVTAGVRVSHNEMTLVQNSSGALLGVSNIPSEGVQETVDTYMFAARYRPDDDHSLYARIASGYRPATTNLPLIDPVTGANAEPLVDADSLWSFEIGAKGQLAEGRLSYEFAFYYIDWDNFQAEFTTPTTTITENATGGITAKGVEVSVSAEPIDGLSLGLNFAFSDSGLNQDEPGLNGLEGQQVPGVPKWSGSGSARYDFALSPSVDAHIGGGFRYVGSKNSAFTDFDPATAVLNIPTEKHVLIDFNAGIDLGTVAIGFYVTNLFDESAFISTSGNQFTRSFGVPVRPRTVGGTLSIDF